jgi:hypothetical protein
MGTKLEAWNGKHMVKATLSLWVWDIVRLHDLQLSEWIPRRMEIVGMSLPAHCH